MNDDKELIKALGKLRMIALSPSEKMLLKARIDALTAVLERKAASQASWMSRAYFFAAGLYNRWKRPNP